MRNPDEIAEDVRADRLGLIAARARLAADVPGLLAEVSRLKADNERQRQFINDQDERHRRDIDAMDQRHTALRIALGVLHVERGKVEADEVLQLLNADRDFGAVPTEPAEETK